MSSVPSPEQACLASSTIPKDGSCDGTPPPAAQWASCNRSPSTATAAATSADACGPSSAPHLPIGT
eukprot:4743273-Pleurochrysis_carterae.AAC.1